MDSELSNNEQLPEWLEKKRDELIAGFPSPRNHEARLALEMWKLGFSRCYAEMVAALPQQVAALQEREKKLVDALKYYNEIECDIPGLPGRAEVTLKELGIE